MVFWVNHLFNVWILLNSPFHLPLSSHHLALLELCSCSCPRADHPISGQCCKFPSVPAAEWHFIQKDYASQTEAVTPKCPGEQSLEQGSWFWVAMGVRMSTWMQSYLTPNTFLMCLTIFVLTWLSLTSFH